MKYFVIMGNTRVGSTWLQTCLHGLYRVFCIREVRWRMPYQETEDWLTHTYIDRSTRSLKERLDYGRSMADVYDIAATGAKFKFDPYGYVPPGAFADLRKIIEEDVHVIMLRRSYFEIFATWKAYGIHHLANPHARQSMLQTELTKRRSLHKKWVDRFFETNSSPLEPRKVIITGIPPRKPSNSKDLGDSGDVPADAIYYNIEDAIDDLLVLFYNDLNMLTLLRGRMQGDLLDYREIEGQFCRIAQQILPGVSREECGSILANAPTRKIEPDDVQLVFPDGALREISDYLYALFAEVISGKCSMEEIVRFDARRSTVEFHLPGLRSILEKHEKTNGFSLVPLPSFRLLRRIFPYYIKSTRRRLARRPVFLPVEQTFQPTPQA